MKPKVRPRVPRRVRPKLGLNSRDLKRGFGAREAVRVVMASSRDSVERTERRKQTVCGQEGFCGGRKDCRVPEERRRKSEKRRRCEALVSREL